MSASSYKYFLGLLTVIAVLFGGYIVYGYYAKQGDDNASERPALPQKQELNVPVGDFTLTDRFGNEFHASDLKGQVWVASFFFTDCSQMCLMLNGTIADLIQEDFADDPVKFVSITVDPKKDNLKTLDRYARLGYVESKGIDPERWIFLTEPAGKEYVIEEIANNNFKVGFGKITHSDRLIIVDREGIIRAAVSSSWQREVQRFKQKLREVLDEEPDNNQADKNANDADAGDGTNPDSSNGGAIDTTPSHGEGQSARPDTSAAAVPAVTGAHG